MKVSGYIPMLPAFDPTRSTAKIADKQKKTIDVSPNWLSFFEFALSRQEGTLHNNNL
jgi:hypothetical protein